MSRDSVLLNLAILLGGLGWILYRAWAFFPKLR